MRARVVPSKDTCDLESGMLDDDERERERPAAAGPGCLRILVLAALLAAAQFTLQRAFDGSFGTVATIAPDHSASSEPSSPGHVEDAENLLDTLRQDPGVAGGVVCRTLLSGAVARHFEERVQAEVLDGWCSDEQLPDVHDGDGGDCAAKYIRHARRVCGAAEGEDAAGEAAGEVAAYTGRWEVEGGPTAADLRVLRALGEWLSPPAWVRPPTPSAAWTTCAPY
jgi:hypothetical protein